LLSSWNLQFQAIDTEVWTEAVKDLERLGISRPPAVVVGDRAVSGWNPKGIAALVGKEYNEPEKLTPEELTRLLDTILAAAQRAVRQFSAEQLKIKPPGRDRDVRHLGFHVFRVALAYADAREHGSLSAQWFEVKPPAELIAGEDIARYGQTVREHLVQRLQQDDAFAGEMDTYYGKQTAPELFERTVWHAAQHLRQLYALLKGMGITPTDSLPESELKLLPLPENLW
jgi:hypothetical protein